ncbi:Bestrophin-2, partial [Armadillidium nasatum]
MTEDIMFYYYVNISNLTFFPRKVFRPKALEMIKLFIRLFEQIALYCRSYVDSIPVTFVLGRSYSDDEKNDRSLREFGFCFDPSDDFTQDAEEVPHFRPFDNRRASSPPTPITKHDITDIVTNNINIFIDNNFSSLLLIFRFNHRYLLDTEKNLLEATIKDANGNIYWVPLVWAVSLIESARKEYYIKNDLAVQVVLKEINIFRGKCGSLLSYDRISIPLVYTQ